MKNIEEVIEFFRENKHFKYDELNRIVMENLKYFDRVNWASPTINFTEILNNDCSVFDITTHKTITLTVTFDRDEENLTIIALNKTMVETRIENQNIRL